MGCVLFVSGAFIEYAIVLLLRHKKEITLKRRNDKKHKKVSSHCLKLTVPFTANSSYVEHLIVTVL